MTARRAGRLTAAGLLVALVAACGKKGPPLPPLRPEPARVTDLTADRIEERVELRFTVPAANADGTTPPVVERIDIYRQAVAPAPAAADLAAPPPAPALATPPPSLFEPGNLLTAVAVRPADDAVPGSVAPGAVALFRDRVTVEPGAAVVWRYGVVPVSTRGRRGAASAPLDVPVGRTLPPVGAVSVEFDEQTVRLAWPRAGETTPVHVFEDAPGGPVRLTTTPIEAAAFETPVEFGRARCYVVRRAEVTGGVTLYGPPSAPACTTPIDRFPPPAPPDLVAVVGESAVNLAWTAVTVADLAGYLVLRGDAPGAPLVPLFTTPQAAAAYRDTAVEAGRTYVYAVVALDRSDPPNRSGESNRETVTIRRPAPRD